MRPNLTPEELAIATRRVKLMLATVAEEVAALPASSLRVLLPVLAEAQREVEVALSAFLAKGANNTARFTAHTYRQLILQLRRARFSAQAQLLKTPRWVNQLREATGEALAAGGAAGGALATSHLLSEVATFGSVFQSELAPLPLRPAAILAQGKRTLVPRFASSAERYAKNVWRDMRRQLAIGVARKETFDQLTKRLQKLGGPAPAQTPAAGLFRRYRHWAERLVRTEAINAYNVHQDIALREAKALDSGYSKAWDAAFDMRVCVICRDLHGRVVDVNKAFPGGFMHPPAHPNCRCALVAWHDDWGTPP